MDYSFLSHNEIETLSWGEKLSHLLNPGDVIGFFGDLGSGKTKTIRGICKGLGCEDNVSSPTFTIINEYNGRIPVYHFDFYRLSSEQEVYDLGYEEYFYGNGICLIEWTERIFNFLPIDHIEIHLKGFFEQGKENLRAIQLKPVGASLQNRQWDLLSYK